jgi:hypothetical protein
MLMRYLDLMKSDPKKRTRGVFRKHPFCEPVNPHEREHERKKPFMFPILAMLLDLTIVLLAFPIYPIHAAGFTWYVDDNGMAPGSGTLQDPFPTIQQGIDHASTGDTVLVADGTFTGEGNKNLDFKGKAITVVSQNGPEKCVIDCEGEGRGFSFHSGEGSDSVLSGFTIKNGNRQRAGGISCENSSPEIDFLREFLSGNNQLHH